MDVYNTGYSGHVAITTKTGDTGRFVVNNFNIYRDRYMVGIEVLTDKCVYIAVDQIAMCTYLDLKKENQ